MKRLAPPPNVFSGAIYEYFLAEFLIQKEHDNGEFFTRHLWCS